MAATEQDLKTLLQRYYAGDTTLEEEQQLLEIFQQPTYAGDQFRWAKEDQAQFLYFQQKREETIPASLSEALEREMRSSSTSRAIRLGMIWRIAAVIVAVVCIGWIVAEKYLGERTLRATADMNRFILPDSSVVWLNVGAELTYAKDFNADDRVATLNGEGYFEIKRDLSKPFVIHTGSATTEVLGTSFDLRNYPGERLIELTVSQGSVAFGGGKAIEVRAGEAAIFDNRTQYVTSCPVNPNAASWKTKQLYFRNALLRDVIRDLERCYHVAIEAEGAALEHCHITVYLDHASVEEALRLIGLTLDMSYTFQNGVYRLSGQTHCE